MACLPARYGGPGGKATPSSKRIPRASRSPLAAAVLFGGRGDTCPACPQRRPGFLSETPRARLYGFRP
jgi:hypothetical protein